MFIARKSLLVKSLSVVLGLACSAQMAYAQDSHLPDLGSSAGELITPEQEQQYGGYTLYQLRQYNMVLDDPLIDAWLQNMGHRLGTHSDNPKQPFTFFMMKDRQINAFATLGGYVGTNAGLVLTAKSEDEVAGVLGHEISHVTQKHVLRSVERAKKDQIPIMLAAIGIAIAAQSVSKADNSTYNNDQSADNASMAALISAQALMAQRQIDYTRSNESEADRIGIQTLYRSGYNPDALADFFFRMQSTTRANAGGYKTPEYLSSHPVTSERISEARDRAYQIKQQPGALALNPKNTYNPLLPAFAQQTTTTALPSSDFQWAKERLRVLSAGNATQAINEYSTGIDGFKGKSTDAQRYGLALAYIENRQGMLAEALLSELLRVYPSNLWLQIAYAQAAKADNKVFLAQSRFEALLTQYPRNTAVILSYSELLLSQNDPIMAKRAQSILRELNANNAENIVYQRNVARAYELSGNTLRAAESYAEVAFLNGRVDDAVTQLRQLLQNDQLDYYQRTRVEARIAEFLPISLELQRQGISADRQGS